MGEHFMDSPQMWQAVGAGQALFLIGFKMCKSIKVNINCNQYWIPLSNLVYKPPTKNVMCKTIQGFERHRKSTTIFVFFNTQWIQDQVMTISLPVCIGYKIYFLKMQLQYLGISLLSLNKSYATSRPVCYNLKCHCLIN